MPVIQLKKSNGTNANPRSASPRYITAANGRANNRLIKRAAPLLFGFIARSPFPHQSWNTLLANIDSQAARSMEALRLKWIRNLQCTASIRFVEADAAMYFNCINSEIAITKYRFHFKHT
jgi:hypothetical protein